MTNVRAMLDTFPQGIGGLDRDRLVECIDACFDCAQACASCADACLAEDMVSDLRACIRTNTDCADICTTTGRVLSRASGYDVAVVRALLEACRLACASCGSECSGHADMHDHCRVCAEACRRGEQACAALLDSLR